MSNSLIKHDLVNSHHVKRYIMVGCFILGSGIVFNFEIGQYKDFTQLKKAIWEEDKEYFESIGIKNEKRFKLWKVQISTKNNNEYDKLLENHHEDLDVKEDFGGERLDETWLIDSIFKCPPPEEHIHIMVQPPPPATTGKRKAEDSDEDIENRAIKKKLIMAQKEDERMIKLLIDSLYSIDTNQQVLNVPPLPGEVDTVKIYNRGCYNYYRKFILDSKSHNRFLITGNPGIGKTYFGRLMLVELLKGNKSVLFDCKDCTLYIDPQGVSSKVSSDKYKLLARNENTWCIIDGKKPQVSHNYSAGKFIMVSSPKRDIIDDFDKPRCKTLYMPTWSEDELFKCWENLYKSEISKEEIKTKFDLCGGIPRWIFDNEMSHEKIRKMITSASQSIDQCILDSQAKLFFGHEFSHKIIQIHTNPEGNDPYTDSICLFASKFAGNKCLDHLKRHNKEKLRTFIESARNMKEMSALRGQLFELISHEILRCGGSFLVRKLTKNGTGSEETRVFKSNLEDKFFWSINEIKDDIQQQEPTKYYRPFSDTFESIDSYVYPNEMFQVTVSRRHGLKQDGLRAIKEILDEDSEINIYFVLPKDKFEIFKTKQPYENKGDGKKFDAWINNIVQYALCIDLDKYCVEL